MDKDQREIRRKLRILEHADKTGPVVVTCRDFGIWRSSTYRWGPGDRKNGVESHVYARPRAKNQPNRTRL